MKNSDQSKSGLLSAEQYIRTRARTLPLSVCYINADWEQTGLASICISRKHVTGSVTGAFYLVDMKCLGVKDTSYFFNQDPEELEEMLSYVLPEEYRGLVDYALVHNLIYGAVEFAEDYGIRPHQDFENTKYILEEDNDQIAVMEFEFGQDDKPLLLINPGDDRRKEIRLLEKYAGAGNYTVIYAFETGNEYPDVF